MVSLKQLDNTATIEQIVSAVREDGGVIVRDLVAPDTLDQIERELAPYFERAPMAQGSFMGLKTQRMGRLIVKSPTARQLMIHPLVLDSVGGLLENECYNFLLTWTEANRVHPGQPAQNIHRDDTVYPFKHPNRPLAIATFWALSDYTVENGASRAVPGSHLWDDTRKPTPEEMAQVVMPRGSVFIFNAAMYHSAGANRTEDEIRRGLILIYSVGWLRQQENQFLAVPLEVAKTLPPTLQKLIGYQNHGYLGSYEIQNPEVVLRDEPLPDVFGASDLYSEEFEKIDLNLR